MSDYRQHLLDLEKKRDRAAGLVLAALLGGIFILFGLLIL